MSNALITVDNVSKKFCRSLKKSLWYGVKDMTAELFGGSTSHNELRDGEFWANQDISFELKRGETVGLIGHNGAGKTTLLRMLNGLIKPDKGRIEIRGRMQALIALGAGFNPILSGRENVYVNAAVLGLTRSEIDSKLDDILSFADIGEFIDAPVQSYSSGMAVRLGFAVAAHMDPDILLIDEVLAVGDVNFRNKCFKAIRKFREKGTGIIVVSHDITQLLNLSDEIIYLSRGSAIKKGKPSDVIEIYYEDMAKKETSNAIESSKKTDLKDVVIQDVFLYNDKDEPVNSIGTGKTLKIVINLKANKLIKDPLVGVGFTETGMVGTYLTACNTKTSGYKLADIQGLSTVTLEIDSMPLYPGVYDLIVTINDSYGMRYDSREGATAIRLKVDYGQMGAGSFYTKHFWYDGR